MSDIIKKATSLALKRQQLKKIEADYLREKGDHIEREKELIVRISKIFNREERLRDCLNAVMTELSSFAGRQVAEIWLSSIDHKELRLSGHFALQGSSKMPWGKMNVDSPPGLIGKAWKDKVRVDMEALQTNPNNARINSILANSLVSGTAIPILSNGEVIAVLGFFATTEDQRQFPVDFSENVVAQLASDIKRKKVEEELFQFFTLSPDLLGMAGVDGYFKKVNPAFTQVLQFSERDLLSRPLVDFVHQNDRPAVVREMKLLSEGNAFHSFEVRFIAKNQTVKWISWSGSFLADEDLLFVIGKDITEKKNLEITITESEERFRVIFEQAAVGVAMLNSTSGKLLRVNKKYCEIFGYSYEELDQMTFMEITHPDDLEADLEHMRRLRKGEIREFAMEKRHFRKDGSVIWVNLSVSPMWKAGETPTNHIAIVQDITARKAAEAKVRHNEQAIPVFQPK